MPRPRIDPAAGAEALRAANDAITSGGQVDRVTQRMAVRYLLQMLVDRAPGHSVEIRIPPCAAAQAVPGPAHRRGTPRAVVEMDPRTWLRLGTGGLTWAEARAAGLVRASGERADLTDWLPLV
ncbi:MAG: sterol carrier family protein [Candidatus Nanopelagicales bacterium]